MGRNKKKSQKQLRELKYWGLCQLHTRILPISKTLKFVTSNIGSKLYKVITNKHILHLKKKKKRICLQCSRCKRPRFDPWVGKLPWRRKRQPTPLFLPGKIPRTEEPGGLQSMGSQRARQSACQHLPFYIRSSCGGGDGDWFYPPRVGSLTTLDPDKSSLFLGPLRLGQ